MVAPVDAVVGLVTADLGVAQIIAALQRGCWRCVGHHAVDRQALQCGEGAALESTVVHSHHLRRDGVAIERVVGGAAIEQDVGLQFHPIGGGGRRATVDKVGRGQRVAQDFGAARSQAKGVACLHAARQRDAQGRGQLSCQVVAGGGAVARAGQGDAQWRQFAAHEAIAHTAHGGGGDAVAGAGWRAARRHDHDRDRFGFPHGHQACVHGRHIQAGAEGVEVRALQHGTHLGQFTRDRDAVELADLTGIGGQIARMGDRQACASGFGTAQAQLVAGVAQAAVAGLVGGHHRHGVERSGQGGAELALGRERQCPGAAGRVQHQAGNGDDRAAVDRDRGAGVHAIHHVVHAHDQLFGVVGVVGAR